MFRGDPVRWTPHWPVDGLPLPNLAKEGLPTIHSEWYLARCTLRPPDLPRGKNQERRWNVVGKNILPVHIANRGAGVEPRRILAPWRSRDCGGLLRCRFLLRARQVQMGTVLARCSALNWTARCAEHLLMTIALSIRVACRRSKRKLAVSKQWGRSDVSDFLAWAHRSPYRPH
jgi:hypothetical protein